MPVTRTANRALRRSKRKQIVNLQRKNSMHSALKKFRLKPTTATLEFASSLIDRGAKWGLLHANKAAHLKSQLAKKLENK